MTNPNLKIPLTLIQKYKLSTLAVLIYGELNGLYSKYYKCEITDSELAKRLNRSTVSIQRSIHDLKKSKLISSKQKANYKGRSIKVAQINDKKYILIPVSIVRNKDLSLNALLVYGSLYSRLQKQIKINKDMKIHTNNPSFTISKSEIAKEINKSSRFIGTKLNELKEKRYIIANSFKGVGIEISFLLVDNSNKNGRPHQKVGTKRVSTYEQNEYPRRNRMSIHVGTKRSTNKVLININKETHFHSSSSNKDLPEETNIPPTPVTPDKSKDIYELNKLDAEQSTTHPLKTQKYNKTAKSGSGKNKEITPYNSASKIKTDQTSNNKDAQSANSIQEQANYIAYDGFNIGYQCKALQHILRRYTGKSYIIAFNQIPLIKNQLDKGLTLYDFESAIKSLIQQGKTISITDLANNLSKYLSKTNSN